MSTLSLLRDQLGILDDGQGVRVLVETLDGKNTYATALDREEAQALRWSLQVNDVEGVRLERDQACRERDVAVEQRRAAEEKDRKGVTALAEAMAGIERLTKERTTAEALAARRDDALATEKLNHDQTKQKAADLEATDVRLRDLCALLEKRAETAEARVKVLEGDADPVAWMITLQNGHVYPSPHKTDVTNVVAAVEPLYRHPPKTGEPVAWRFSKNFGGHFVEEKPTASSLPYVTPLYEAPPPAAIGVEGERFACLTEMDSTTRFAFVDKVLCHQVGSRVAAEEAVKFHNQGACAAKVVRIVPADARVVDLDGLRKIVAQWEREGCITMAQMLRAAIGEKAGS